MVLPQSLVSTYQQYKQDTDSVATWLASTAKSLGFPADLLTPNVSSAPQAASKGGGGGRVKGKARAEAKKQAASAPTAAKQTPPLAPAGPKHVIKIWDFVSSAQYLAGKAAPVPVAF